MLEIIKDQYKHRKVFVKNHFYQVQQAAEAAQISNDLYPLCLNYYHEMNPAFLFSLNKPDVLDFAPAVTIRDGSATFAAFVLKNYAFLPDIKSHLFIHEGLSHIVPPNVKEKFSCWKVTQKNKLPITKAKKVFVYGLVSEQAFPNQKLVEEKLKVLSHTSKDCEIEVFLPIRSGPLGNVWKESSLAYDLVAFIRALIPHHKIKFMIMKDVMERFSWNNTYCLDLMDEKLLVTDSYLNHFMARRGATISSFEEDRGEKTEFEIDLSFDHKISFYPLVSGPSIFADLIFYKKHAGSRDYANDPGFHALLREHDS